MPEPPSSPSDRAEEESAAVSRVMELALVAFPCWDEAARLHVESLRAEHDPRAARIQAHFTLVFPTRIALEPTIRHVESLPGKRAAIPFVIRRAVAVSGDASSPSHVFLVPDEGGDAIVALHDRLYTGELAPSLRADLPFVPHVTIAEHSSPDRSTALAARLNRDGIHIRGVVDRLHLLMIDGAAIDTVARFDLS